MNNLTSLQTIVARKTLEKRQKSRSSYIDQNSFFKVQVAFVCLFVVHDIIFNLVTSDIPILYISSLVTFLAQILLIAVWKKKRHWTPILILVSMAMFNWTWIEFLNMDLPDRNPKLFLLKSLPMAVANLITIQNLSYTLYKVIAICVWLGLTVVVAFDKDMLQLLPLLFIMLCFIISNFMLIRKRMDRALNSEHKLTRTIDKLKILLDGHINDGVVVIDIHLKEVLFSNMGFHKIFKRKESGTEAAKNDIKFVLNKILIEEEGARKDEPVFLIELLEALKENFVQETYETNCKFQTESGEYKTFVVKVSQTTWDFTKSFVMVFTDISEQEILKELRANEETQDHLMDVFAHELRTPVKNILGALDFLVKDKLIKQEGKDSPCMKYINICQLSCKYLQSISNTFLDIARFKNKAIRINVGTFSMKKLIYEVKEMVECQTQGKNLKFEVEIAPDVPENIVSDRDKVEQILLNLLTNAIKFTFSGYIKVQAKLDTLFPDSIEICVIDSGMGIRNSDKDKLFRLFSLLRNKKANPDGAGLGLSISQKLTRVLAENDDDRGIRVESSIGKGSKFTFSITSYRNNENCFFDFQHPMLPEEKKPEVVPKSIQKLKTVAKPAKLLRPVISQPHLDFLGGPNDPLMERTPSVLHSLNPSSFHDTCMDQADEYNSPTHMNHNSSCILVVDDNPVDLMLISQQLDTAKISYKTVLSGEACLDQVDESIKVNQPFRGILLDCYMADLSGFQTAKILRARMLRKEIPEIPIIAISAHDNQENREKAFKAGMSAWYTKPLRKEDVEELFDNYFKFSKSPRGKSPVDGFNFVRTSA